MSKQTIFDTVSKHLLTQKKQAKSDGTCVYLARDGCKCAIGCLIPPKLYAETLEGSDSFTIMSHHFPVIRDHIKSMAPEVPDGVLTVFLRGLQRIHDESAPDLWKERLENFAVLEELTFNANK